MGTDRPEVNTSEDIRSRIYTIRGVQVMLDSDLAEIYGYETKRFNEQVKNNIARFPEDFMFQLTSEEADMISRSKKSASIRQVKGKKGGRLSSIEARLSRIPAGRPSKSAR